MNNDTPFRAVGVVYRGEVTEGERERFKRRMKNVLTRSFERFLENNMEEIVGINDEGQLNARVVLVNMNNERDRELLEGAIGNA